MDTISRNKLINNYTLRNKSRIHEAVESIKQGSFHVDYHDPTYRWGSHRLPRLWSQSDTILRTIMDTIYELRVNGVFSNVFLSMVSSAIWFVSSVTIYEVGFCMFLFIISFQCIHSLELRFSCLINLQGSLFNSRSSNLGAKLSIYKAKIREKCKTIVEF